MKRKDDFIDNIFRNGFRNEEQFSKEVPENMFDDFFPEEESIGRKNRPFYWYRFSAAAALFLSIVGFSWHYLRNLEPVLVKNIPVQTLQQQPSLISQVTPKTPEVKISPKEPKAREPSKLKKEKPAEKQPSRSRSRKKRIGATLFPGIFPTPLFAEERQQLVDTALALVSLPQAATEEKAASSNDVPEESAIAYANEVESVEYHPEKPSESPADLLQEKSVKQHRSILSVLAGARQIDFSKLPSIEEAKGLLFSGIGRLVGLNREPEIDHAEQNSNSEL